MSAELCPTNSILIVDDEVSVLNSLRLSLKSNGINNILCVQDSRDVLDTLSKHRTGIVLLDLTMPYISGQELLSRIREDFPEIATIVITGTNEVSTAVECIKLGALDYFVKAVETGRLIASVNRVIEIQELKKENSSLKNRIFSNKLKYPDAFVDIITRNIKMKAVFLYIESIAETNHPVLINGKTGVGKEHIARVIHYLSRRRGEYVPVNISGFDDNIFSDTLFGHRKGAYTGAENSRSGLVEIANSGTLFLDEIGDLSHSSQVRLLRLLDTNEYFPLGSDIAKIADARIVAATNKDLVEELENGRFRKDLYYRLTTHKVQIPALSERMDDLPILIEYFIETSARELGKKAPTPPPELFSLLETYHFPGNIRELKSMIFDAVSRHKSGKLSLNVFKSVIGNQSGSRAEKNFGELFSNLEQLPTLEEAREGLIGEAVKRAGGNQSVAARLLGITHQALNKHFQRKRDAGSKAVG